MNTLDKDFVPYEEALAFKELGFNEPCFAYYNKEVNWNLCWKSNSVEPYNHNDITKYDSLSAPTFSQCFRWFREKYGLHPHYFVQSDSTYVWCIRWFEHGRQKDVPYESSNTYEEAELACLRKLIEIVKEKQL